MTNMRGIDLGAMKKVENTVIGFEVAEGFINTEKGQLSKDRNVDGLGTTHVAMPCLEVTFIVANGERRKPFVFTLANVLPMIHAMSDWGIRHATATIEDAPEEVGGPRV